MLDFRRMDIELPAIAEYVDENLRGFGDRAGRVETVPVADQRKIGQRLALANGGTSEHEEIAEHAIAEPNVHQAGEAVEDEIRLGPRRLNHAVNLGHERLELATAAKPVDFGPERIGHERLVLGEAEIDELLALGRRRSAECLANGMKSANDSTCQTKLSPGITPRNTRSNPRNPVLN